jgi:hypothetical protein
MRRFLIWVLDFFWFSIKANFTSMQPMQPHRAKNSRGPWNQHLLLRDHHLEILNTSFHLTLCFLSEVQCDNEDACGAWSIDPPSLAFCPSHLSTVGPQTSTPTQYSGNYWHSLLLWDIGEYKVQMFVPWTANYGTGRVRVYVYYTKICSREYDIIANR